MCTPRQGVLLAEVRALGLRCLTPEEARDHLCGVAVGGTAA
ncbi:hypothetical protein [Saccharopolyspora thermophila]|nr:hypothetical protein [Saccharopolyspora subtropica]